MFRNYKKYLLLISILAIGSSGVASSILETKVNTNLQVSRDSSANNIRFASLEDSNEEYKRTPLTELELISDLGSVRTKDSEVLLQKFLSLNPNLNPDAVEIVEEETTESSAFLNARKGSGYSGSIEITFTIKDVALSDDLKVTNLGFFHNYDEELVFEKLREVNPGLILIDLDFFDPTDHSVLVKVSDSSTTYQPKDSMLLSFEMPPYIIDDYLKLEGAKYFYTLTSDKENLMNAIERNYKNLDLNEINIFDITSTSFMIQAKETSFKYRFTEAKKINFRILGRFNLGELENKFLRKGMDFIDDDNQAEISSYLEMILPYSVPKNDGYEPMNRKITLNKDFTISYKDLDSVKDREKLREKEKKSRYLIVKAKKESEYLVGSARFLISSVTMSLGDFSTYNHGAIADHED